MMNLSVLTAAASLSIGSACAAEKPRYADEAPLPEGWPRPGPYGEVVEKTYPAHRAAFAEGMTETGTFWTLFLHIKKNGIPMTAPVSMEMSPDDAGLKRENMAFLYQNTGVGETGPDGSKVKVRDLAEIEALTYAWQGADSDENRRMARRALDSAIEERGIEDVHYRLLGYNGPGTPDARKTWELLAIPE